MVGRWNKSTKILLSILYLFSLFSYAPCFAENSEWSGTPEQAEDLETALRVHTLLIQLEENVQTTLDANGTITDDELQIQLKTAAQSLLNAQLPAQTPLNVRERVWKALQNLNWQFLVAKVRAAGAAIGNFAKKNGIAAASSIVLGTALDVVVPIALIKIGKPEFIPISAVMPYQLILYGTYHKMISIAQLPYLIHLYGGRENFYRVKTAQEKIRKEWSIKDENDLIFPLLTHEEKTLFVNIRKKSGHIGQLLEHLGWKKAPLSYQTLKAFSEKEKKHSDLIQRLDHTKNLNDPLKAIILLHQLARTEDPQTIAKLKQGFPSSFRELKGIPHPLISQTTQWIQKFRKIETVEDLQQSMDEIPHDLSVASVASLWEKILLPIVGQRLNKKHPQDVKRFYSLSPAFIAQASIGDGKAPWFLEWRTKFLSHFGLKTAPIACQGAFVKMVASPLP